MSSVARVIEVRTLGTLDIRGANGAPVQSILAQPKRTALLLYLLLARPRGQHQRERLTGLLWAERDEERARKALRQALYYLRASLGDDILVTTGDSEVGVADEGIRCDAVELARALERNRPADALGLYGGDLLPGFHVDDAPEFENWLEAERTHLRSLAAEAAWRVSAEREAAGDVGGAIECARRAASFAPGEEAVARRLMELLGRVGDRAAALRTYEELRALLAREFEVEPSSETAALAEALRAAPALTRSTAGHLPAAPPAPAFQLPTAGPSAQRQASTRWQLRWAAVTVLVGALLVAAKGLSDGLRNRLRDAPGLDSTRYVVLPFEYEDVPAPLHEQQIVYDALAHWQGISAVDLFQVRDVLSRREGRLTLERAFAAVRELGAGRLVWGEVTGHRDALRVRATLYDPSRRSELRSSTGRLPAAAAPDTLLQRLVDELLFGRIQGRAVEMAAGTPSAPARLAFERAQHALNDWNLQAADSALMQAISHDPQFTDALLWLALVRSWSRPLAEWEFAVERAAPARDRLPLRAAGLLDALLLRAAGDHVAACATYRRLSAAYRHDFVVWYSLGDCLDGDSVVVPDGRSPSGWSFRSSYHSAVQAYSRAFTILPSAHKGLSAGLFAEVRRMLRTSENQLRMGRGPPGGSAPYLALPSWQGDTLAYVPYPAGDVAAALPQTAPGSTHEAVQRQRQRFRELAHSWTTAFPRSPEAYLALALALDLTYDQAALDTLRHARSGAGPEPLHEYLAALEVLLQLKHGLPDDWAALQRARLLADSLLRTLTPARTTQPEIVSALAAIAGRPSDAAEYYARVPAGIAVPQQVLRRGQRLVAYSAFGGPVDSIRHVAAQLQPALQTITPPELRSLAAERWLVRASTLAFTATSRTLTDQPSQYYLHEAQLALQDRDTAAVRARLQEVVTARSRMGIPWLPADGIPPHAHLLLMLGDTAAAERFLDQTLGALYQMPIEQMDDAVRIASLLRAVALRADIAHARADRETARRWSRAIEILWRDVDPKLRLLLHSNAVSY